MQNPLFIATLLACLPVLTQAQHAGHGAHSGTAVTSAAPQEPGQGGFAAIAEIVVLLEQDPDTNWSRVDITALRDHLIDMDQLITETSVTQTPVPAGLQMQIDLPSRDTAALRMVPAHAQVLEAETGWQSHITDAGDHLLWTVTAPAKDVPRLRALGFFGLMATGDHHRAHHLSLAKGVPMH